MHKLISIIICLFVTLSPSSHAKGGKRSYGPDPKRYASIIIDADTGKVLHGENATLLRHPASMTKMMTLYLIFDALKRGKITLQTQFRASVRASQQEPSKLGLQPGELVSVATIIDALITKSANDAAVTAAEGLEGSEIAFSRVMTNTARRMGMSKTVFKNASGLPNKEQVTTAQDMARLGQLLIKHFPQDYKRFQVPSLQFRGHFMRNHNKLLGKVDGVDGIKTGFINMSGHNVTISAKRNGRRIIVVVMGGKTSHDRWKRAEQLVEVGFTRIQNPDQFQGQMQSVNYSPNTAILQNDSLVLPLPRPLKTEGEIQETPSPQLMDALVQNVVHQPSLTPSGDVPRPSSRPAPEPSRTDDPIRIIIEENLVSVVRPVPREEKRTQPKDAVLKTPAPARAPSFPQPQPIAYTPPQEEGAASQVWAVKIGQFNTSHEALNAAKEAAAALRGGSIGTVNGFAQGRRIVQARIGGLSRNTATQICKIQASKGQACTPMAHIR